MGDKDVIRLIVAVGTIFTLVTAIVSYIQAITGRISPAEYITEVAKSQIPGWVWILTASPVLGVIIILIIAYGKSRG